MALLWVRTSVGTLPEMAGAALSGVVAIGTVQAVEAALKTGAVRCKDKFIKVI